MKIGRHEFQHAPAAGIAGHQRVEIILELADLIDAPFLRQSGEGIGDRSGAIIIERRRIAPQRDIDPAAERCERQSPLRTKQGVHEFAFALANSEHRKFAGDDDHVSVGFPKRRVKVTFQLCPSVVPELKPL
jgi:hypothetical protein